MTLLEGEIAITHRLVDASNATLLGEIDGVGRVIYKPIAGERPLWDFPDGTLADREVAAYKLSDWAGFHVVPTTVLREGPYGPGMVQIWIETDPEIDLIEFGQRDDRQLRGLSLFDAIINNTDRKFGHLLVDSEGKLFGCDHGVTFHSADKLRTVLWQFAGEPFTEDEKTILRDLLGRFEDLRNLLDEHLTIFEIEALKSRSERLMVAGQFPYPSDEWPSVPWPPV